MPPKVFISYSWSSPEHEDWVTSLAQRLVHNGIDVAFDKWDLKEGHDKYSFMESMVSSNDIYRVLIILDKKYTTKANERSSGVGTETQIISPNIYKNVAQEKFIPIVTELDENGQPFIPTYLEGRIYIDLSTEENFELNYEKLIRNVFNKPSHSKPKLGKTPSYIEDETPISFKTSAIIRGFDSQIDRHPERANSIGKDFLDAFFENLKEFRLPNVSEDWGQDIVENLNQYRPLRDDYISFILKISKNHLKLNTNIIINFFEYLPSLFYPEDTSTSWTVARFDNFKFITHELFIYTIEAFLRNENYDLLEDVFYSRYFIVDKYRSDNESKQFDEFCHNLGSISYYYNNLHGMDFISPQADFLIKRIPNSVNKDRFIEADLLCHYIGLFNDCRWMPITYIYRDEYRKDFPFLNKLISKKHFDVVKGLLGVQTVEELKTKLENLKGAGNRSYGFNSARHSIPDIARLIKSEEIASSR